MAVEMVEKEALRRAEMVADAVAVAKEAVDAAKEAVAKAVDEVGWAAAGAAVADWADWAVAGAAAMVDLAVVDRAAVGKYLPSEQYPQHILHWISYRCL